MIIVQQGNSLVYDLTLLPIEDLTGTILAPTREKNTKSLQLLYDILVPTRENYPVPATMDFNTAFPGDGTIVLTDIPIVFAMGYRGVLPQDSLKKIQDFFMSPESLISITGGKVQNGIHAALTALALIDF